MDTQETDSINADDAMKEKMFSPDQIALVTVRHTSSFLSFALPNEELYHSK